MYIYNAANNDLLLRFVLNGSEAILSLIYTTAVHANECMGIIVTLTAIFLDIVKITIKIL